MIPLFREYSSLIPPSHIRSIFGLHPDMIPEMGRVPKSPIDAYYVRVCGNADESFIATDFSILDLRVYALPGLLPGFLSSRWSSANTISKVGSRCREVPGIIDQRFVN